MPSSEPIGGSRWPRIQRAGDLFAAGCVQLAAFALAVIVVINGANVVGRYVFNAPIIWAEELMVFLMIGTVFFAAIAVSWHNTHIRIEIFLDMFPRPLRTAVLIVTSLISVAVLVSIGVASVRTVGMLRLFNQRSDALEIPLWIPQAIIAFGLFALAAMILLRLATAAPPAPSETEAAAAELESRQ